MPKIVPVEVRKQILEDLRQGYSAKELAERFGVSQEFISRLRHKEPPANKALQEGEPDPIAKLLEEKDKRITILEGENFRLRETNTRLKRQMAENEKRTSFSGVFRELMLVQALRDLRG